MQILELEDFLNAQGTMLDVRSPAEFVQGRIPGALNLPLFDNDERAVIGTIYKQQGRDAAVEQGLRIVGPKLADFAAFAKRNAKNGSTKVLCWRGGMRSSSMAWLLETAGLKAAVLKGGYKTFRRWVLDTLQQPRTLKVIGGLTGSGKTEALRELKDRGEQVLDLEALAQHRGSTFGMLGMPPQPSTEQFENEIALVWDCVDPLKTLWVEDESRMIGTCKIPDPVFKLMRTEPMVLLECPLGKRIDRLLQAYGQAPQAELIDAVRRLEKRLGGARTNQIVSHIENQELRQAVELLLCYYDAAYMHGLSLRTKTTLQNSTSHNI